MSSAFTRRFVAALLATALAGPIGAWSASAQDLSMAVGGSVTSMDPHFHNLGPNNNIASHIFDRLIHFDAKQQPTPGLAESWRAVNDTTWELKLRKGVKFHDGSDFDADDVLASFKRVPWVPNSPSSFAVATRAIKEVKVIDKHTLHLMTERPHPLLPLDLATVNIVSRKNVEAPTADFNTGKAAVGTGPWKFVEFVPGDRVVLERNDAYWGAKPHWKKATIKIVSNNSARVAALLAGDVQLIDQVPPADLARLKGNANIVLTETVGNRVIYLHLDSHRDSTEFVTDKDGKPLAKNPLKDARVRKALSLAINRQAIVERLMEGAAIPAGGLLAQGFFGVGPNEKPDPFDVERAKKMLADAGYKDGLHLTAHGPNNRYLNDAKVLEAVGQMWARAGVNAKIVTQPWSTFISAAAAPKYTYSVILVGWGSDTGEVSSPLRALLSTVRPGFGTANRGRFSNAEMDKLLEAAMSTVDNAKRGALLAQATEVAMREQGIIPLFFTVNVWAARKGVSYEPRADEYTFAHTVKPAN
jgi:peptide/nickel transport system substrate-binding protein